MTEREKAQVGLCKKWINEFTTPTVNFRHKRTSYSYKHLVERYYKIYISNLAFIVAVKELNFESLPEAPHGHTSVFKFRLAPNYIGQKYFEYNEPGDVLKMLESENSINIKS